MKRKSYSEFKNRKDYDEILKVKPQINGLFNSVCQTTQDLMSSFKIICMLGVTGHGKSSLANVICGENTFEANAGTTSVTEKVQGIVTTWRDISTHVPLICIDTPGFGDSEGRDPDHVDNIVSSLKTIGYVNTFIITWNCLENRFSEQLDSTIRLLS
jgi:predicted GTPase